MEARRYLLKVIHASNPEKYGSKKDLRWSDCWAEAETLSDAKMWERRARYEGFYTIIATIAATAQGKVGLANNGPQRMFAIFVKSKEMLNAD